METQTLSVLVAVVVLLSIQLYSTVRTRQDAAKASRLGQAASDPRSPLGLFAHHAGSVLGKVILLEGGDLVVETSAGNVRVPSSAARIDEGEVVIDATWRAAP